MEKKNIRLTYKTLSKLIHPDQVRIIRILEEKNRLNISQIQKELKKSSIETYRHLNKLNKAGLITKEKKIHEQGSPVFISLKRRG